MQNVIFSNGMENITKIYLLYRIRKLGFHRIWKNYLVSQTKIYQPIHTTNCTFFDTYVGILTHCGFPFTSRISFPARIFRSCC